jgi:hypothetical protein
MFFFEKKSQETFSSWHTRPISNLPRKPTGKSFLLLFFKKEGLAYFFS